VPPPPRTSSPVSVKPVTNSPFSQDRPAATFSPACPVSPCGPCSPRGPVSLCGPCSPWMPWMPWMPCGPVAFQLSPRNQVLSSSKAEQVEHRSPRGPCRSAPRGSDLTGPSSVRSSSRPGLSGGNNEVLACRLALNALRVSEACAADLAVALANGAPRGPHRRQGQPVCPDPLAPKYAIRQTLTGSESRTVGGSVHLACSLRLGAQEMVLRQGELMTLVGNSRVAVCRSPSRRLRQGEIRHPF
jgi:hypothetical protein